MKFWKVWRYLKAIHSHSFPKMKISPLNHNLNIIYNSSLPTYFTLIDTNMFLQINQRRLLNQRFMHSLTNVTLRMPHHRDPKECLSSVGKSEQPNDE